MASNLYSNANGSIGGNGPHNPFINQTATFTITGLTGVNSDTRVTSATFSFGTTAGVNVDGCVSGTADCGGGGGGQSTPEQMSLLLSGTGLVGLYFIRRRSASGLLLRFSFLKATASPSPAPKPPDDSHRVTVTAAGLTLHFQAASHAFAARVWVPLESFFPFRLNVYGEDVLVPESLPSTHRARYLRDANVVGCRNRHERIAGDGLSGDRAGDRDGGSRSHVCNLIAYANGCRSLAHIASGVGSVHAERMASVCRQRAVPAERERRRGGGGTVLLRLPSTKN